MEHVAGIALFSGNRAEEMVILVKNQQKLTATNNVPKPEISHLYLSFLIGNQYTKLYKTFKEKQTNKQKNPKTISALWF